MVTSWHKGLDRPLYNLLTLAVDRAHHFAYASVHVCNCEARCAMLSYVAAMSNYVAVMSNYVAAMSHYVAAMLSYVAAMLYHNQNV